MPKFMNLGTFLKMDEAGEGGAGGGGGAGGSPEDKDQGGAGGAGGDSEGGAEGGSDKGPKTLEEALGLIKKLNDENAKHRLKNKSLDEASKKTTTELQKIKEVLGIKDENEETPEIKISSLTQQNEALQMQMSVMQLQLENGISGEQGEYFQFLLQKKFAAMEDDAELTDEDLAEIVEKAKGFGGGEGSGIPNKTSVNPQNSGKAPTGGKGQVTLEQFVSMSMADKSELYGRNPALYDQLMTQANSKKLIK
jgi:hypothetical protein